MNKQRRAVQRNTFLIPMNNEDYLHMIHWEMGIAVAHQLHSIGIMRSPHTLVKRSFSILIHTRWICMASLYKVPQFESWQAYINYMAQNHTYRDQLTLFAAANLYNLNIQVVSSLGPGASHTFHPYPVLQWPLFILDIVPRIMLNTTSALNLLKYHRKPYHHIHINSDDVRDSADTGTSSRTTLDCISTNGAGEDSSNDLFMERTDMSKNAPWARLTNNNSGNDHKAIGPCVSVHEEQLKSCQPILQRYCRYSWKTVSRTSHSFQPFCLKRYACRGFIEAEFHPSFP